MGPSFVLSSLGICSEVGLLSGGGGAGSVGQEGGSRRPQLGCDRDFLALCIKAGWGTHRDFVLPCEIGCFTQQLRLRHSEDTGCGADEHCVVEPGIARSRRQEIPSLQGTG